MVQPWLMAPTATSTVLFTPWHCHVSSSSVHGHGTNVASNQRVVTGHGTGTTHHRVFNPRSRTTPLGSWHQRSVQPTCCHGSWLMSRLIIECSRVVRSRHQRSVQPTCCHGSWHWHDSSSSVQPTVTTLQPPDTASWQPTRHDQH